MIHFTPTDEQQMLMDAVRRYSLNEVRPAAHEADEHHRKSDAHRQEAEHGPLRVRRIPPNLSVDRDHVLEVDIYDLLRVGLDLLAARKELRLVESPAIRLGEPGCHEALVVTLVLAPELLQGLDDLSLSGDRDVRHLDRAPVRHRVPVHAGPEGIPADRGSGAVQHQHRGHSGHRLR